MSKKPYKPAARFVPCVESLEDRSVPAGNVQAGLVGGVLWVVGDAADNHISVTGFGGKAVAILSTDGTTTVNGRSGVFIDGIKHGVSVAMGAGNDDVLLSRLGTKGDLFVDMGDGDDNLTDTNDSHHGATNIFGGNGNDTITLNTSGFGIYLYIDAGFGDDTVVANQIAATPTGLMSGGGNDFFDNRGSLLGSFASVGFAAGPRPVPPPAAPFDPNSFPLTPADTTAPVATITTTAANPTNASSAAFTVTFSENVSGFTAADITVANGSVVNFAQVNPSTYTFNVTPSADGQVTVSVNAGAAADAAGNVNAATSTSLVFSRTPPSFTASNPPTVGFNAGAQTVTNFATFTKAPFGGTTPTYTVSSVSNPGLFAVQPKVASNGTLTYSPVTGGFGSSTFAVSVSDGLNSSATQTFTIHVDPVQGAPTTIPGTTILLNNPNWVTIPTVVPAGNSAGIPAGTVADGTRILDETVGNGATVTRGAQVTVAYKGFLLDGTIFDQNASAQFTADELHLIPGFAAGLIGMKVGGTRDIDISSYLAYGSGTQVGTPNSRLVFQVTVNSIP
jgi:hypothetical protein